MVALFRYATYQPVKSADFEDEELDRYQWQRSQPSILSRVVSPELVFLVNLLLFGAFVVMVARSVALATTSVTSLCAPEAMSVYSPIFDRVAVHWETKTVNADFWPGKNASIYQQLPSPEVDEAWDRISSLAGFPITSEEGQRLGKDLSTLWPHASAEGSRSFTAQLDLTHELHCLDLIRRFSFPMYYGDLRQKWAANKLLKPEQHLVHCTYLILQSLTCHADLEVITFNKLKGFPGPFADFSVERTCRNYDQILEWLLANQMDENGSTRVEEVPAGIVEVEPEGRVLPPITISS